MKNTNSRIAVVYLAWIPYGIDYFKSFLESYLRYENNVKHKLIIAFNGLYNQDVSVVEQYLNLLKSSNVIDYDCKYYKEGQDIKVYKSIAAELVDYDYFLFLNTYSIFHSDNWLEKYVKNMNSKVGVIGASGAYSSYFRSSYKKTLLDINSSKGVLFKWRQIKYLFKLFLFHFLDFYNFPNPHIRTNAFFINRELFCSLKYRDRPGKINAYSFENGRNSMTNQLKKRGLEFLIIDKVGNSYSRKQWIFCDVFWQKNQQDLIISDNQTRMYSESSPIQKLFLQNLAWGNSKKHN